MSLRDFTFQVSPDRLRTWPSGDVQLDLWAMTPEEITETLHALLGDTEQAPIIERTAL